MTPPHHCHAHWKFSVLPNIEMRVPSTPTIRIDVALIGGTDRVAVVENIVEAQASAQIRALVADSQVFLYVHQRLAIEMIVVLLHLITLEQTIGGIIFRSRFGDNLHLSDVGSAQSVKFHRTGHLLVVNIDERRTLIQAF